MLSATRCIVFDLDGTLVDTLPDIMTHFNAALVDHGLATRDRDTIAAWVGYGAEQLVAQAVPNVGLIAPVLATFRARYHARPVIESRVYDGLAPVLDALASRYQLAVLSNKPHELALQVVEQVCSRWPFAVVAGRRRDRPAKPDPRALRAVADELGIDVPQCVLVGDSEVDIETARATATSVAVSWGMRPLSLLVDAQPDHLVHTPAELGALFA